MLVNRRLMREMRESRQHVYAAWELRRLHRSAVNLTDALAGLVVGLREAFEKPIVVPRLIRRLQWAQAYEASLEAARRVTRKSEVVYQRRLRGSIAETLAASW